jgi:hypothetical protein
MIRDTKVTVIAEFDTETLARVREVDAKEAEKQAKALRRLLDALPAHPIPWRFA